MRQGSDSFFLHFLVWFLIGGSFSILDELHEWAGITEHSHNVFDRFPTFFSPIYAFGAAIFYSFYVILVGNPRLKGSQRSITGGNPISLGKWIFLILRFCLAYLVTALLGGFGWQHSPVNFLCSIFLVALAFPDIWFIFKHQHEEVSRSDVSHSSRPYFSNKRTSSRLMLFMFFLIVVITGVATEWMLVNTSFGFSYRACPSLSCLGTSVPMSWLPFLYMHCALFMGSALNERNNKFVE